MEDGSPAGGPCGGFWTRASAAILDLLLLYALLRSVEAGLTAAGESVSVESVTGYGRRFSLGDARRLVLATDCAGRSLSHGHGFPLRLVVPDQRGYDWVKWVMRVRVVDSSHLLQPPLPLA